MARVLVIDDEPKIVSFVSRALTARGFSVDSAHDGRRGYQLAAAGGYQLVLLDLVMPGLDGVEVLEATMRARPHQCVMVLSAMSDVQSKLRCFELGAADYLTKPFSLLELLARVRARLRGRPSEAEDRHLRAGGLTLDVERRAVDVGDGAVPLSTREFLLLRHLVEHHDEVCTREELLAEAWGYSFDPGTNVVDVYVSRLRTKLTVDIIETVRGVGYSLAAP